MYSYSSTYATTRYTLSSLRFGEMYNISVRVQLRAISSCYSYFYGEYSDVVSVVTVETGKVSTVEKILYIFDAMCTMSTKLMCMYTAPTGAPTQFHVNAINSTSIEVLWELPPYNSRGGVILGYKLFITPTSGGSERTFDITDNSTDVFVVGGLQPATSYRFSVLAYTRVGDGPRSIALTIATLSKYTAIIKLNKDSHCCNFV